MQSPEEMNAASTGLFLGLGIASITWVLLFSCLIIPDYREQVAQFHYKTNITTTIMGNAFAV